LLEEPLLRRRLLLPSRVPTPSLLQGNPFFADSGDHPYGDAELATQLYPPLRRGGYETVYEGDHRYRPFEPDELYVPGDLDSPPAWAVRMEPFTSYAVDDTWASYDRRHLVTTISYDDLLSRGGAVTYREGGDEYEADLADRMFEVVQASDIVGDCPDTWDPPRPLPFEYIDYPVHIENGTVPGVGDEAGVCDCPTRDVCRFDTRKGRLKLSLAYLDKEFPCEGLPTATAEQRLNAARCKVQRQRLIHDVFMMLVRNARGPYWDERDCTVNPGVCDEWTATTAGDDWTGVCASTHVRVCKGGSNSGAFCTEAVECPGGSCDPQSFCYGGPNEGLPCVDDRACPAGLCRVQELCYDPVTGQTHREALLSRTAASLTANLLDYMDFDDANADGVDENIPTRVALRSFDFSAMRCMGGTNVGGLCRTDSQCPSGTCVPVAGRAYEGIVDTDGDGDNDLGMFPEVEPQYVYGLERQPYISEVATAATESDADLSGRAIELINPYRVDLPRDADGDGRSDFMLIEVAPGADAASAIPIPVPVELRAGEFTVLRSGYDFGLGASGGETINGRVYDTTSPLQFLKGWTIYLVRRVNYPGDVRSTEIVVDQFTVGGQVGEDELKTGLPNPRGETDPYGPDVYSLQRTLPSLGDLWRVSIPDAGEVDNHRLIDWNTYANPALPPVEVNFANTGSFTKLRPDDDRLSPVYGVAFPTTGSMLLTMRHANRSLEDHRQLRYPGLTGGQVDTPELSFTTWLDNTIGWRETDMFGASVPVQVVEMNQVDNGRMPVFDQGEPVLGTDPAFGRRYLHHEDPGFGVCCLDGNTRCVEGRYVDCVNAGGQHVLGAVCDSELTACQMPGQDKAGGVAELPWGQLVFDYFTALPLRSLGPYEDPDPDGDPEFVPGKPDSIPRVEENGLRVHGRININAAPWKVLSGVPMIPMQKVPVAFRAKTRWGAGLVDPFAANVLNPTLSELYVYDNQASPIGSSLAQAITAYRELRQIDDIDFAGNNVSTGHYGGTAWSDWNGHGWDPVVPASRRGPGFLTVGELAQVRHEVATMYPDASGKAYYSYHQIDLGALRRTDRPYKDFVEAVGLLVALGDWVTVRSQVFTVYGSLRGEFDGDLLADHDGTSSGILQAELNAAEDVDTRAIRFQETVDRLPTLQGAPAPVGVGERTTGQYIDARTD
jgi:hypothetical protein